MKKLKMHTPDMTLENIDKVAALFPNCLVETKDEKTGEVKRAIDFDQLRQELSDRIVDGPRERYHLDWPGKREALLAANAPIAKTLRPCREESVDFDTTKNLFIEGDNLDALKVLRETYLGKVKLIYIDPPYNTGSDLLYNDDYSEGRGNYLERSNQTDEIGSRLVLNTEANGRFHSDWLSMLYARLKLAKNLLRDDGVLFLQIGEEELCNADKVLGEIFGETNKLAIISRVAKTASNKGTHFAPSVDFIISYAKNIAVLPPFKDRVDESLFGKTELEGDRKGERYRDDVALYQSSLDPMRGCKNQRYYIEAPDGSLLLPPGNNRPDANKDAANIAPKSGDDKVWRWSFETYLKNKGLLVFKKTKTSPLQNPDGQQAQFNVYTKSYLSERQADGTLPRNILTEFINRKGADLLKTVGIRFEYSKPVELVQYLCTISDVCKDDIVLDFFAGSCTTAHALMEMNASDGGRRRHIMIQLPESCDGEEGAAVPFKTIAEIGKERIRRFGALIKSEHSIIASTLDIGFRVLKVDTTNMADVYYAPDAVKQTDLVKHTDNIKPGRTPEDLLFQVLVDWGVDLTLPITQETVAKKKVFFVDGNALVACFDLKVSEDLVKQLAKRKPLRAVFRDSSYDSDSVKINVEQIFKLLSPETEVKTL
jgi:adenine-specific DNA-methyltransferase